MSLSVAVETESLFEAVFLFFWSKLLEFNYINVHGVWVFGHSRRGGERLEGLSGPSTSLSDLLSLVPLVLEVDGC